MSSAPRGLGLLLLGLSACTPAPEASRPPVVLASPTIDTLPGGAVRVTNSGPSAWADTSGWSFAREREIVPPDGDPGELAITDGLAIDHEGSVYAVQRAPARVLVFDSTGQYARTIGSPGEGPGEIQTGFLGLVGDTLFLQQPNPSRLSLFHRDGRWLSTFRTACCMSETHLVRDPQGRLWVPGSMLAQQRPGWARYTMTGQRLDLVLAPLDPQIPWPPKGWSIPFTTSDGRAGGWMIQKPLQPKLVALPRHDGLLLIGRNDRHTMVLSTDGQDSVRLITFPSPSIPLSSAEHDSIMASVMARLQNNVVGATPPTITRQTDDLPAHWPTFTGLHSDPEGRIWLGLGGVRGELTRLLVFAPDGVLLGEVPPPHPRFFAGVWGPHGRLVIADELADGTPRLVVFRLRQRMS